MNFFGSSLILIVMLLTQSTVLAQQAFVEGELVYKITIRQQNPEQKTEELNGLYTIKIKGTAVLKELLLDNNIKSTKLIQSAGHKKACFSLIQIGQKNFAVQQNFSQVNEQINRCSRFGLKELPQDIKTYSTFKTKRALITCNDQMPFTISYTEDWVINNPYIFEEFSAFTYLPLYYQLKLDNGNEIICEFVRITPTPMNSSDFEVPKNYTIISQEELHSWQH